ncbi:MAG: Gfo/Idh/MocA family protein [Acidimicrobiia bacterium]
MSVDRIRWGIAATGGIARGFAAGLAELDDAETVAVASRTVERAEAFGGEFGIPNRHASYEALAADPDVDIVYVASPHSRHETDTLLFLEAGKSVLCEKPFAINAQQASRMIDAARSRGLFLMEAIWSRFLPSYVALRRILDDRVIGEPLVVEADFGLRFPKDPAHRLFDLALGGGALLDLGIYPLQLASLVLGPPEDARAVGFVGDTGADEQVAAVLSHQGGALALVQAATQVNLSCTARISGTDGSIDLPAMMHCPNRLTVTTGAGVEEIDAPIVGQGLRYQVTEVHRCLRDGLTESPTMPLAETLALAATMDRIRAEIGVRYPGE